MTEVEKLISEKQIAIAWFLTQYLVDKEDDDANKSFGGFGGMAKGGMWEDLDVQTTDGLTYTFNVQAARRRRQDADVEAAAAHAGRPAGVRPRDRQADERPARPADDERGVVPPGAVRRVGPEQGPRGSEGDDDVRDRAREGIDRRVLRHGAKLTDDGTLDIDLFFGWDYHDNFHIKHSQDMFTWLVNQGFKAPVSDWDHLTKDIRPRSRRRSTANGKPITVEVRLYFGKPGTATDPDTDAGGKVLESIARASLKTRDVVVYSGHSGPFYGFALANWNKTTEGDLDDSRDADHPAREQVPDRRSPRRATRTRSARRSSRTRPRRARTST